MAITLFIILAVIILVWLLSILFIVISEIKAEITPTDEIRIEPLKNSNKLYTPEQVKINEIINIINHDYQEDKK